MKPKTLALLLALQSISASAEILVLDCTIGTTKGVFYSIQYGDPRTDNVNMKAGAKATVTDEAVVLSFSETKDTIIVITRQSGTMQAIHGKEVAEVGHCVKVPPKI